MALSDELITRYTSEVDVDWRWAFVVSHPAYPSTADPAPLYLIDYTEEYEGLVDGFRQTFTPVPARLALPSRGTEGRQDLTVEWCGIAFQAKAFLDTVIQVPEYPVSCRVSAFILGDPAPQVDPWIELYFTQVGLTRGNVIASASRVDVINRPWPTEKYRVSKFPGMRRQ